ncbi:sensor histidine kinase [uncultured Ruminococcus sp.]|uniref:sensor histidine kinase n=1 Tax=uncultured Ruminococcus sp. TaxID=165186 RepID=UPI0025D1EE17|nr:GHKL domain-containing protein [uncultured Ruminococcus sp.]HRU97728.1 GHKL domain-containing protein [Ruminococcus sp.]
MIYNIAEFIATVSDCAILFWFLISSLSFKKIPTLLKVVLTSLFSAIMILNIVILNYLFTLEGVFTVLYLITLFSFSMIALQGRWWHQLVLSLVGLLAIFLINAILLVVSSFILREKYDDILIMRNPARIFLLFLSKLVLICMLIPVANLIRNKRITLHLLQSVIAIIALMVSVVAGITVEKMILEQLVPPLYATIIMVSLAIINILIFFILVQFTMQNQSQLNQVALQTRLNDDEKKLQESVQWSKSVRALRHDLSNHLISISQFIKSGEDNKALAYIEKISGNLPDAPFFTDTNNPTLNAILDLKRMSCQKENINLKCYIQKDLAPFDDTAFSTVFGNIMDNAIEAEKKETQKEIRLSLESKGAYLHITVQNRIQIPVLVDGKLPDTTKCDKRNHGLGMYSVMETVTQNNGAINIYEKDGWLIVDVLMLSQ